MARAGGKPRSSRFGKADDAVVMTGLEDLANRANVIALGVTAEVLREIMRPEFEAMVREAPRNTGAFVAGLRYTETKHGAKYTSRRPYTRYIHWPGVRAASRHRGVYVWWHYADEVTLKAKRQADEVAERIIEALENAS